MSTVLVREGEDDAWRVASPCWEDIPRKRAESIVEEYNSRSIYDTEYKIRGEDE